MTNEKATIENQLWEIYDRDLIYPKDETVVYQSIIEKQYPAVNVKLLCACLSDNNFSWRAAIKDYLEGTQT